MDALLESIGCEHLFSCQTCVLARSLYDTLTYDRLIGIVGEWLLAMHI